MGFIKNFKRDFAQAVNELLPESDEKPKKNKKEQLPEEPVLPEEPDIPRLSQLCLTEENLSRLTGIPKRFSPSRFGRA